MPRRVAETTESYFESTPAILLDTHVAIWLSAGLPIKRSALALITAAFSQGKLWLSPISAWEIGILASKKRLDLGQSPLSWLESFVRDFSINVIDFTPETAINSSFLPGKFHGDPADRIIIATARAHSVAVASADEQIIAYGKQGLLKVLPC